MGPGRIRRVAVLAHASVLDRTGYARRAIDAALAWRRVLRDGEVVLATIESPKRLRDRAARVGAQREVERGGARLVVLHALPRRLGLAALSDAAAARTLRRFLAREKIDLVHAHGPRAARTALRAAHGLEARVVADVHGDRAAERRLERGAADDAAAAPDPAEAEVVRAADGAVHASAALAARLPAAPGKPSQVVPCLVAAARVPGDADAERLREEGRRRMGFGADDRVVAYAGSLAPWQEATRLARLLALAAATEPRLRVLFLSPDERGAARVLASGGLRGDVVRVASPPADRVIESLLAADAGVLLRRPALANTLAFPTKVAEYLAAGLSVVASDAVPAVVEIVEGDEGLGEVVPWTTDDETWARRLAARAAPATAVERAARRAVARRRLSSDATDPAYRKLLDALQGASREAT
jgi:glycosyltransferase involved in cell wall biosynthesis